MADKDKYEYKFRVPWQETCWSCQVDSLNFQCTDELAPLDHFIGQERALEAAAKKRPLCDQWPRHLGPYCPVEWCSEFLTLAKQIVLRT